MKSYLRFATICLFITALSSNAIQPAAPAQREPVILNLFRALGSAVQNGPVVITALGASLVVGVLGSLPATRQVDILSGSTMVPMTATLLGMLLAGNHFYPAKTVL